ncbi:hypothetical protein [Kineothrix sp. MB12-C1]|uniref:hypothetical protein n=1 Tax=Kineothrix sp. MB12-C1 TaxID=3070215 RepID=UPI002F3FF312
MDQMEFYIHETKRTVKSETTANCYCYVQRGEGIAGCLFRRCMYLSLYRFWMKS